jgi:hypothetical protein
LTRFLLWFSSLVFFFCFLLGFTGESSFLSLLSLANDLLSYRKGEGMGMVSVPSLQMIDTPITSKDRYVFARLSPNHMIGKQASSSLGSRGGAASQMEFAGVTGSLNSTIISDMYQLKNSNKAVDIPELEKNATDALLKAYEIEDIQAVVHSSPYTESFFFQQYLTLFGSGKLFERDKPLSVISRPLAPLSSQLPPPPLRFPPSQENAV